MLQAEAEGVNAVLGLPRAYLATELESRYTNTNTNAVLGSSILEVEKACFLTPSSSFPACHLSQKQAARWRF